MEGTRTVAETACGVMGSDLQLLPEGLLLCYPAYAAYRLACSQLPMQGDRAWGLPQGHLGDLFIECQVALQSSYCGTGIQRELLAEWLWERKQAF